MADSLLPTYLQSFSTGDRYSYPGVTPELAMREQGLNRRQQIANLLIQRGLQPRQGGMAGRFYVAPSPVQGLADLASIAAGAFGTHMIDQQRKDLSQKDKDMLAEAIERYKRATGDGPAEAGAPPTGAAPPMPSAPASLPAAMAPSAPAPDSPSIFSGQYQMGADVSGWEPKGPIPDHNAQGAAQQQVAQAMVPEAPVQGPVSPGTPARARTPEERRQAVIDLMANQHPQAQAIGKAMLSLEAAEQERAANREFLSQEKGLDREARLDAAKTQLNQALLLGLITKEQKDQMLNLQKQQLEQTGELKRLELETKRETLAQGKTPPGYRKTDDGNLEAIPGGPADLKMQGAFNQDTAMLQNTSADMDRLAESANQILNHPGLSGITGLRGSIPDIPGTQAADARALLNKLKSQVGFSVLQNMRNNSKTGGALGNVSDAEGKRLENNLASVESAQSIDQMKRELQGIIDYTTGAKDRLREAFNLKHKTGPPSATTPPPSGMTPTVPSFHDPEKQKRYEEFKKKHKP